ncbi:MAG: PBPRA1643 family SWIM/SEC-C metal-binding motif protein [Parashewanella sp.]
MSDKFFFKGRQTPKPSYGQSGYNVNRVVKLGTAASPLSLTVTTEQRKKEVQALVEQHNFIANIIIDASADENISQLKSLLNKPKSTTVANKPNRNDPCSCGSGIKYKKCCG